MTAPDDSLPPMLGLRHLALSIEDARFEVTLRFYREGLGMQIDWAPDPDNVYLSSGPDNLALHRAPGSVTTVDSPLDHLGFAISSPEAVAAWHRRLSARADELEIELLTDVKLHRDGATSFYLRDPAGHRVQLVHIPSLMA